MFSAITGERSLAPSRRLVIGVLVPTLAVVTALAAGGIAVASDTAATPRLIEACYRPGHSPAALAVLIRGRKCPAGDKTLTWNQVGPQGPPGISVGVSATDDSPVPLSPSTFTHVLQAASVPVKGVYYVSASVEVTLDANDSVDCQVVTKDFGAADSFAQAGPFAGQTSVTLPFTGAVTLAAGDAPIVTCIDGGGSATEVIRGAMTATLINNAIPAGP
jgi:hypothetical protein